ncbi:MAG: hypothetical protein MJY69_08300 [Bacteroidales bacterium]|nr:hypothetical protein [Bacteroidales bacterium]
MQVLKFGGSSVANATNISKVLDIVEAAALNDRVLLVCSAIKGCTAALIAIGRGEGDVSALLEQHLSIINRLFTGEQKAQAEEEIRSLFEEMASGEGPVEAYGEILSTRIIERKLSCEGRRTVWLDSRKLIVSGDEPATFRNIAGAVQADCDIFVAPGFIAGDAQGRVCTLGRGGSDYSAALYAAGSCASDLQIWTDVPGIMTTNPKVVPAARTIPALSYNAARLLAENGAKVLYAPTVRPAMEAGIAFRILNTFDPEASGTLVGNLPENRIGGWRGLAGVSEGENCRLCLVGEGPVGEEKSIMRVTPALNEAGIRILGVESSDEGRLIYVNVLSAEEKAASAALHAEFFENPSVQEIKLFIAGYGAVGKALVRLVERSGEVIERRTGKSISIVGVSDSSHYIIDLQGFSVAGIEEKLPCGQDASDSAYFEAVRKLAPRGSVFVDCTPSKSIGDIYESFFEKGINVISSNRRALAVPYSKYVMLKSSARENGVKFSYDTTVGAAMPILESLSSGANSSDKLISLEAVVSCTLNNIYTEYDALEGSSFASLLRQAQDSGLTESDPRSDLGGEDALRKLLIMAREAGIPLESSDVSITPVLGPEYFNCPLDRFYELLQENEWKFVEEENRLASQNLRQRFVASVSRDAGSPTGYRASIEMKPVGQDSPFYWISGTENVTIIKSENITHPLVLRGSGEGALTAAGGVINDILKI